MKFLLFFFLPFLSLRGKLLFFTLLMWVSLSPQASPSSSLLIHNPINIFAFSPFKKFLLLLGESLLRHGNIPGVRWVRALIQLYSILKLWMGEELQWGEIGSRTRAKVNMVLPFLLQSSYQREVWTSWIFTETYLVIKAFKYKHNVWAAFWRKNISFIWRILALPNRLHNSS